MSRYLLRGVLPRDHADLAAVAKHLNSVNLPDDPRVIEAIIDQSVRSFRGEVVDPRRAEYVFALEDRETGKVVGTSMIFGQLGRKEAPYIYFDVRSEEKYSSTLDKHFHHTVLRIGYSYDGPTEIGGIVLAPDYRAAKDRLGLFLSYVRFLFIARNRERFQDEVLAELLPPLLPDGRSHLWEALGKHFTDLTYMEADKLSKRNKEFIKSLFPEGDVYASLLPQDAQEVIGKVGPQTKGVERLLTRIGFRYCERIDPFDGGPHFLANTDEISLVRESYATKVSKVVPNDSQSHHHHPRAVVGVECVTEPYWKSLHLHFEELGDGIAILRCDADVLGVEEGEEVFVLPVHPQRTSTPLETRGQRRLVPHH